MYDEKMIEDSLAFAEEIQAKLAGRRNAAMSQQQQAQQTQGYPVPQPQVQRGLSQSRPVQGQYAQLGQMRRGASQDRPVQGQRMPSQGRPVPPPQMQRGYSQSRPMQGQRMSSQGRPVPPPQIQRGASQSRPVPGQPVQMGRQIQRMPSQGRPVQGQMTQRVASQSRPLQGRPVQSGQPLMQRMPSQGRPVQGQPGQMMPQRSPVQGQTKPGTIAQNHQVVQGQPVAGTVQNQPIQGQPVTGASGQMVQAQPLQSRPVQGQPIQRVASQPVQGQQVPGAIQQSGQMVQNSPIQRQQMSGTVQQPVQGMASQPVQGQQVPGTVQQPGQIVQNPSAQGQQMFGTMQQSGQMVQNQPQPVQGQPQTASAQDAAYVQQVEGDSGQNGNHTYEITIKLDVGGVKNKLKQLRQKLAPEPRTLEDVNAAIEENRQLQMERQEMEPKSIAQNGVEVAGKVAGAATGTLKKIPNLFKRGSKSPADGQDMPVENGLEAATVDPMALDAAYASDAVNGAYMDAAQVVAVEGESAGSRISEKLGDMKESLSGKAGKASGAFTNVIIIVLCLGIALLLAGFINSYVAHQTTVEGESMEPTLSDGDTLIVQRLSYYFHDPERYDVVVFPINSEDDQKIYYIKRVIGLPGETVQIIDGTVYINDVQLTSDQYAMSGILEPGIADKKLVLGENQYFVMGDNRNLSSDSRNSEIGPVNKNDMIGKAWICTWPLRHFGAIKN